MHMVSKIVGVVAGVIVLGVLYAAFLQKMPTDGGGVPDKSDFIRLTSPLPNTVISSPLTIRGVARGSWFFEASFPIALTDWDGRIIAETIATAEGDWMTEDFVPFTATLTFDPADAGAYSDRATLILQKENASGLPEHDDALEIPLRLAPAPAMRTYSSAEYGISFSYPSRYLLAEHDSLGSALRKHHAITLLRREDLPLPENGEGPPAITIDIYQNNLDKQTTEQWIRNSSASNFKLGSGLLTRTTVSGLPALSYNWSGLYEGTTVAVAEPNWIYAISGTYMDANSPIVRDFKALTESVRITKSASRDIVLAVGQTGTYDNLSITLNEIESDSRCPVGVACIWAGAVTANVTLENKGQKMTSAIVSNTAPIQFGGYSISIADVTPPAHSGLGISKGEYRLTFRVN